jgi:hypothetical protein
VKLVWREKLPVSTPNLGVGHILSILDHTTESQLRGQPTTKSVSARQHQQDILPKVEEEKLFLQINTTLTLDHSKLIENIFGLERRDLCKQNC